MPIPSKTSLTIRWRVRDYCLIRDQLEKKCREAKTPCEGNFRYLWTYSALQFLLHGVRRVLGLFARPLNVLPHAMNRVAGDVRAYEDQHQYRSEDYLAHSVSPVFGFSLLTSTM